MEGEEGGRGVFSASALCDTSESKDRVVFSFPPQHDIHDMDDLPGVCVILQWLAIRLDLDLPKSQAQQLS